MANVGKWLLGLLMTATILLAFLVKLPVFPAIKNPGHVLVSGVFLCEYNKRCYGFRRLINRGNGIASRR